MKKLILPAIALALVASACSPGDSTDAADASTTTVAVATTQAPTTTEATTTTTTLPPTSTTTLSPEVIAQEELEADTKLIKKLWRRFSDSWGAGIEEAATYGAQNVYPDLLCTSESVLEALGDLPKGYAEEHIVDAGSIELDEGWTITGGPSDGEPIDGRIYIFTVESIFSQPGFVSSSEHAEVHTTIVDGKAYFFLTCWPAEYDE
jgi:hypothetical protein